MTLPLVPNQGGYVVSTFLMVVSAWISLQCGLALHKAFMAVWNDGKGVRMEAYEEYASEAAGKCGEWTTRIFMCILFTGILAAYTNLMASELVHLFDQYFSEFTWKLLLIGLLCILSMIRDISLV